jgi:hypothetical protein
LTDNNRHMCKQVWSGSFAYLHSRASRMCQIPKCTMIILLSHGNIVSRANMCRVLMHRFCFNLWLML